MGKKNAKVDWRIVIAVATALLEVIKTLFTSSTDSDQTPEEGGAQ